MAKKIPKEVIEELKLKEPKKEVSESGKVIVEKHQVSVKIPHRIKATLNLKKGSYICDIILKNKKTILIKLKDG